MAAEADEDEEEEDENEKGFGFEPKPVDDEALGFFDFPSAGDLERDSSGGV